MKLWEGRMRRVAGATGRGCGHTSWSRARAAPLGVGASWHPRWWRAPRGWGARGPACRPWRAAASRVRCAGPPRAAVLCPRRDALRATPSGGLFNNAVWANGARPSTDVRADIDRDAQRRGGACPKPPSCLLRSTSTLRAHYNVNHAKSKHGMEILSNEHQEFTLMLCSKLLIFRYLYHFTKLRRIL